MQWLPSAVQAVPPEIVNGPPQAFLSRVTQCLWSAAEDPQESGPKKKGFPLRATGPVYVKVYSESGY